MWVYFTGIVFATVSIIFLANLSFLVILNKTGISSINPLEHKYPVIWIVLGGSLFVGSMITVFVGKTIIKPIKNISNAFTKLSGGNFDVRVDENKNIVEINEMAKGFNAMAYDLSHIETLRNDFVVNVSHEFKTPIASIEGYATLLQNDNLSEEKRRKYTDKILSNSQRLSNLLTNILSLSKLENQETVFSKGTYRLDEQLRKIVLLLENKWIVKNIEFDINLPKYLYYGNEPLLDQVWYNIVDNAIKYSPENSKVKIEFITNENNVTVVVKDNGCGMSEEIQKHIFEKFYQGDSSRKTQGNGLGLALVKRIIDLCDGIITVNSNENQGTEFLITLPNISDE